jgi:hypothetical protein
MLWGRHMKKSIIATLFACAALVGCATVPLDPEGQATYLVNSIRESISNGDNKSAIQQIEYALVTPTGEAKVKEFLANSPKGQSIYYQYLKERVVNASTLPAATSVYSTLNAAKSAGILPEAQTNELIENLGKKVASGNTSGLMPIYLGENTDAFPELKSPEHQQIIVNRSIKTLQEQNRSGNAQIAALMDYVKIVGVDSSEGNRVKSLLPTINIRGDELDVVAALFPDFAASRKEEITARVFVQIKNGDRMFSEDVLQLLHNSVHGVEWNPDTRPAKAINITIERVRHDEINMPERSQTITYSYSEVNLLANIFLMPENASYIYDLVSGRSEIEYGYAITATLNGKTIHDKLIRGKVGGEYHRCQNEHIRNVFGGDSSANFVANSDMAQRCSGPDSLSMENLRKQVLSKIVNEVLEIPPIKVVNELNPK